MAEVQFSIGPKDYAVSAQDGEERLLQRAAELLGAEARQLLERAGRMPEARLLLLAGLMLADRLAQAEDRAERIERDLKRLQSYPARVEVPVPPAGLREALEDLAARAEAIAGRLEDQQG